MVHDINASNTASEPVSPRDNDISYCDWQSSAGAMIEISIDRNIWPDTLVKQFKRAALKIFDDILAAHDIPQASVSLRLCDDLQMRSINSQYRQIDRATNVLSFPAICMPSGNLASGAPVLLGDIVIAAETVMREAGSLQIPAVDHLMHLFVHGMLHLFGYDHTDDDTAETMETLEKQFLVNFGIANPYEDAQLEVDS